VLSRKLKKQKRKKKQNKTKVIWKERSIHPDALTHITPVLYEKKAIAPLRYDAQSLRGIVTVVNQNKFFPNTFSSKTLYFYKGTLSRLVKSKQGKTAPVYIRHQKDAHLAVSQAQPLQWAEYWNMLKQKRLIHKDRLGASQ